MRFVLILGFNILLTACASSTKTAYTEHIARSETIPAGSLLSVKVGGDEEVSFFGEVNMDDVNVDHGSMAYLAPNPAVFAASILAHAVIVGAADSNKKHSIQEEANKVLEQYTDTLSGFTEAELLSESLTQASETDFQFVGAKEGSVAEWVVDSSPVYFMSPDQTTLTLKNAVSVYSGLNPKQMVYQNLFEVVSAQGKTADSVIETQELQGLAVRLFAESLASIDAELVEKEAGQAKEATLHYYAGGKKIYERGLLLAQTCDRMTFRSLRGWVKTVPSDDPEQCVE